MILILQHSSRVTYVRATSHVHRFIITVSFTTARSSHPATLQYKYSDNLLLHTVRVLSKERVQYYYPLQLNMSATSSKTDYEPVKNSADEHHNDDDSSPDGDHSDNDEDLRIISVKSSKDSDEKTQPTSNLKHHHLSFDLEEEESELQRYRLSPSTSSVSNTSGTTTLLSKKLTLSTLWQAYLEQRLENKRRRAEVLLAMNEDSMRERVLFIASTWTDLFDNRGVILHFIILIIWLFSCHLTKSTSLVVFGILCIVLRLTWRPLYWYVYGRQVEKRRKETMVLYDELNGSWSHGNEEEEEELSMVEESNIV